jgi:AI-2 transport protein TqsA
VRLASVFGLLTFLLNYIPNVGSMIAMLLPIPVIYVDDELSPATVTL